MEIKLFNFHILPKLFRWFSRLPPALQSILIVVIYVLAGLLLDEVATRFETSDDVTAWYPPAGLHFVLLLKFGLRYTPELLFIPLLDGLVFTPQDIDPSYVLLCALCVMLGYGLACEFLLQRVRIDPRLLRFHDVLWFTIVALVASLAVALAFVTVLAEAGDISWSEWGMRVLHSWAGDSTGIAMVAPPLLLLLREFPWNRFNIEQNVEQSETTRISSIFLWLRRKEVLEWGAEIVAVILISCGAYGIPSARNLNYTYFIFLPQIWIAMRHGFQRTVLAVFLLNVSVATYVGANIGNGNINALALQFGLMTVSYTALLLGSFVTQYNRTEKQLLYEASHDSLTQLYNRAGFMDKLEAAVARLNQDENYMFGVIFLDLDRFKVVNDSLGHAIGDKLLQAISVKLQTCLRPEDTVARFGGDEFTILLDDIKSLNDATRVAVRINEELGKSFNLDGYYVFTAASIGITLSSSYSRPADLLRDANIAMYRAKNQGRGQYAVFDRAMHVDIVMMSQLENDLRQEIEEIGKIPQTQLQLYYQPIVRLDTGKISGFEALLRWHHPQRGLISPCQFIPVAEETGLIIPIGRWVLREACRQMRVWHLAFTDQASLTITVNLSSKQFLQPNLVEQIKQILQEVGLNASSLKLEITESVVMENPQEAGAMLTMLRNLGVQLSIDDFGTGYSSLSRLNSFPVSTLKIDRSFITQISSKGENLEIIRAIITLAKQIGMSVTAEGIETATQLAKLKELNCEEGQGYFFSQPLTNQAAQDLIVKKPQW